jgi:(S)-beta-tyrosine adenylation enzyme
MDVRETSTSAVQDGLWFLAELAPGAHTWRRSYRVRGDLDVGALRTAWLAVVARHESLRTTIVTRDGQPVRRIAPEPEASAWAGPGEPEPAGSLAWLRVERLGAEDHLVHLTLHRVICDDEAVSTVVAELAVAYGGELVGQPPRYGDFVGRADRAELVAWWRDTLTPLPPALDLPADRDRSPAPSAEAGVLRFDWGPEIGGPLAQLATEQGVAPADVLLAAFQTLLHRYTGEDRIAVGTPVSVRPPEFAGAVGAFHNTVVLCTDFADRPPFRTLLHRVAEVARDARDHRELPFQDVVRAVCGERDPRRVPMCDAVFVALEQEATLELAGTSVQALPGDSVSARADLTLTVDGVVGGTLEYRAELFEPASAQLILDQLRILLAAALADPSVPVDKLPLDSPERLAGVLRDLDGRAAGPPGPAPANELVHHAAVRAPESVAISWQGTAVSYRELRERAARIAAALPDGIGGQPVVVRMATGPWQVAALLAVLDAGAYLVCLGGGDVGRRGQATLGDVRPACLVLDGSAGEDHLARWYVDELGGQVLDVAALPEGAAVPVRPDTVARAYVAYTSGSTGQPKGIPQSHGTFAQFVTWFAGEFRIGPGARLAQWAAPGYDASLCEVFGALAAGATLCPVPDRIRPNPEKLVDWLVAERITHFQTVPSFAREILRVISSRGSAGQLGALTHLLLAGERLPGDLANGLRTTLPDVRLVNLYGPTELILATWHEVTGPVHGTVPIGRPLPGRQLLVLDDQDRPCPTGVTGNLVVRGPHITPGYLGAASGEREQFRPIEGLGACYRTGDLGRLRWDGALEFVGRKDFQVKFNGIRLELGDIEAALAAHDSVAECAVVAVADTDSLVTRLVAYVVPVRDEGGKVTGTPADWRSALRGRFGKAMPPVSFTTLIGMPRNVGGKVDRKGLPAPTPARARAVRGPETPVEWGITVLWRELGADPATVEDTFFAVGGHSLLVPKLLHELQARFGATVPLWEYFANPTVAGLAALVEAQVPAAGHDH